MTPLPETHRALVLTSTSQPPEVKIIPTPQPTPGSAVVRIEAANIISYSKHIYNGTRPYPFSLPLVIGTSAIGRIAALGPDSVSLKEGQLVFIDSFVRARDDEDAAFLFGVHEGHTEAARRLMRGEWRDCTYAEYAKVPLENCYVLDVEKLGVGVEELQDISRLLVPYGGLRDIDLKTGESIIIAPATGTFGSAATKLALAMGARVIGVGRNLEALKELQTSYANDRFEIAQITGDVPTDLKTLQTFGTIDAYLDISPPEAANSTHFKTCMLALRKGGRVSLMGGLKGELTIPVKVVVSKDLRIRGKWMYERQDVRDLIKMIEVGVLKLGGQTVEKFGLDEWEAGFDKAVEFGGSGGKGSAIIVP
ncbi:GroES-like protein [Mollisia scopiformis]|uniref:GroES-like protein n=1 Tax=Mollisia scopiformis TaxID=149040 RepID=A0A132BBX2_MOLSC|nr:GroES-like protein [Mollisia scopiformis]KUJ09344.1 GroES-like protein [Mollisia scopiformis]